MADTIKVLIAELNGTELAESTEYEVKLENLGDVDATAFPPATGKVVEWNGTKFVAGDGLTALQAASYGEINYFNVPGTTVDVTVVDQFEKLTFGSQTQETGGTTLTVDEANGEMTVGADGGGEYKINFGLTFKGTGANTVKASIFKNGSIVSGAGARSSATNNKESHVAASAFLSLVSGDVIGLRLTADTTNADPVVISFRFNAVRGATGSKGAAGPAGADGDITWEGTWVTQNYLANQAVYYAVTGQSYVCHTNTTASQVPTDTNYWDILAKKGDAGSGAPESYSFTEQETNSATYVTATKTIFPGSSVVGTPSAVKVIARRTGSAQVNARIWDATNSLQICELTAFGVDADAIYNLGTISNVPTGEAIWELQFLRNGGAGPNRAYIRALNYDY